MIVCYSSIPYRTFTVRSKNVYVADQYGIIENVLTDQDKTDLVMSGCQVIIPLPEPVPSNPVYKEAAETILQGQIVTSNVSGKLVLAKADHINNCNYTLFAGTGAFAGETVLLTEGFLTLSDWSNVLGSHLLTINSDYFLSDENAGMIMPVPPSTTGHLIKLVGISIDRNTMALSRVNPIQL